MKMLLIAISLMLFSVSCSSDQKNELKKSFSEKVSEKVKEAAVRNLGCETGNAVYSDVKNKIDEKLSVKRDGQKAFASGSVILTALCEQGVKIAFPYLVDMATGKLPAKWIADGCSMQSVGNDLEKLAFTTCRKLE